MRPLYPRSRNPGGPVQERSSETHYSAALKDADHLLHDILTAVDTSKDGLIQYSEFKHFFEGADRELWRIFRSVDQDRNGKIDKGELRIALTRAGIAVDTNRLEEFFYSMDKNNDGVISFEEWRYGRWRSSLRVWRRKTLMCINVALLIADTFKRFLNVHAKRSYTTHYLFVLSLFSQCQPRG